MTDQARGGPNPRTLTVSIKVTTSHVEETDVAERVSQGIAKAIGNVLYLAERKFNLGTIDVHYESQENKDK